MAQPTTPRPDLDIRSQQVRLLETWNTYRAHIEDNTSYKFSTTQRPRPSQQLMILIERGFASHSIEHCVATLHELRKQLHQLFDDFETNMDSFELLGAGVEFSRSSSNHSSVQPDDKSVNSSNNPSLQPVTSTSTLAHNSSTSTPTIAGLPNLMTTPNNGAALASWQLLTQQASVLSTSSGGSIDPNSGLYPLSERLQHDLISLPVEIFAGLLHHSIATSLLQDVLPSMFESTKRHYVMIIFDIIYLVWKFFILLVSHKTRFVLMVNYLLQANIISAAIHCILNTITQAIATASLTFLLHLFKGDEKMILLFVQNYNVLPVLKMRFQFCVNIDLLQHIQHHHPTLPNSAEVALRVKTPQDPLGAHHLQPLSDLLQLYLQIETALTNHYDKHYVDNAFIHDCHAQMIYVIRYIQLLASQSSYLYHNPEVSTALPPSLQIPIAPTLYLYPNPLYFPMTTPQAVVLSASKSADSRNSMARPRSASNSNQTPRQTDVGLQFDSTTQSFDAMNKKSTRQTHTESTIYQPEHFRQTVTTPVPSAKDKKSKDTVAQVVSTLHPAQAKMLLLRPALQTTVEILHLISKISATHDEIPDIFLYQNIGIIPTAIKLGVRFKLDKPLISFSPATRTK